MAFQVLQIVSIAVSINIAISASITLLPTARNTTLYSNVSFECATNGGPAYWILNGTYTTTRWNDGIMFKTRQVSEIEYNSMLHIHATVANNNTQVQCGVFDITSPPVLLLIQGKLYPPRNIRVNFTTYSQINLIWEEPPTLDMINETSLHYLVTITSLIFTDMEWVVLLNTSKNGYTFFREDYRYCDLFKFYVTGVNDAGLGYQSEGIEAVFLGSTTITSSQANVSTSTSTNESIAFHCTLSCGELNQVVTWFINNNTVTNMDPSSYQTTSDYHNCRSGALNYTETLDINIPSFIASEGHDVINDVVTIYCGVVSVTNKVEYERDRDSVTLCYSRDAFLTVSAPDIYHNTSQLEMRQSLGTSTLILSKTNTTSSPVVEQHDPQTESVPGPSADSKINQLLLGMCIGLLVTLILFIFVCIGTLVCMLGKSIKQNKGQTKTNSSDPVYEMPFSVQTGESDETKCSSSNGVETGDTDGERIYDQPKTPSPQPDMQPCAAYHTTQRHHH